MSRTKSYKFGIIAEIVAATYLRMCLYSVIYKRYKTKVGEIDLIAKRGKSLVFVEVKARKNKNTTHTALTKHQQNRITRTAELFIAKNPKYSQSNIRFDLILICPSFYIKHIKNAWYN